MINFESTNKWQLRLVTLVLFALGFAAGVFALNAYNSWFGGTKPATRHERYQEAFNQLNLTAAQDAEVQKIVAETRENIQQLRQESEPKMQNLRARHEARLQSVLTAEQWTKFQDLREVIRQSEQ
ncbi:MAG: hypothetical protein M3T96_03315 [Acidobacteriota bacterium]|nr:hypothetical protein [Acidobacteriota bacterium]